MHFGRVIKLFLVFEILACIGMSNFCCHSELIFVLLIFLRTLVGIIDDYFDGYYTEEMIESQVQVHPKGF